MNTWTLEYTRDNPEMGIEVTCKIETTKLEAIPELLEKFIEEGQLLEFHLTLNIPKSEDDEDWEDDEE